MMWFRLRRVLAEKEVFIGLGIFGGFAMLADFLIGLGLRPAGTWTRGIGLALFIALVIISLAQKRFAKRRVFVPLLITEESNWLEAQQHFEVFVRSAGLEGRVKTLERFVSIRRDALVLCLSRSEIRATTDAVIWRRAWHELLDDWEQHVDTRIAGSLLANEQRCYQILPHVVLPLAFALGASVNLRRSLCLYHHQEDGYYRVLDLWEPRSLLLPPPEGTVPPEVSFSRVRSEFAIPPQKAMLHLFITDRHTINFAAYSGHASVISVAIGYRKALNPDQDWLPYVQAMVKEAQTILDSVQEADIALIMPSACAFAFGMAFSRNPGIRVCHWIEGKYEPVFALREIEVLLPFD